MMEAETEWQIGFLKERGSKRLHGCVSAYLRLASSVHIGADGVVRPCSAHIQMGPVPRFDQADEVSTFPLKEETKNTIKDLGQKQRKKEKEDCRSGNAVLHHSDGLRPQCFASNLLFPLLAWLCLAGLMPGSVCQSCSSLSLDHTLRKLFPNTIQPCGGKQKAQQRIRAVSMFAMRIEGINQLNVCLSPLAVNKT